MKIFNNLTNTNFKGYKNVISTDLKDDRLRFMFFSLQLNDEGNKDLTKFREIKKMISGLTKSQIEDDVLTLTYKLIPIEGEILTLDNTKMSLADDLFHLEKTLPALKYKSEEDFNIKAYTFLANLTRRMMKNGLYEKDRDITKVISSTINKYKIMMNSEKNAFEIINYALLKNKPCDKIAYSFNRGIYKNMEKFFKII